MEVLIIVKTSPLICRTNQWTGFYMIGISVMRELMVPPQIFNIRILILSWPCTLFELRFWIILPISPAANATEDKRLAVTRLRFVRSLLLLSISERWFEKKSFKSSTFCLKYEISGYCGITVVSVVWFYFLRTCSERPVTFWIFSFVFCTLSAFLPFKDSMDLFKRFGNVFNNAANKYCYHFDENICMLSFFV